MHHSKEIDQEFSQHSVHRFPPHPWPSPTGGRGTRGHRGAFKGGMFPRGSGLYSWGGVLAG